MSLEKSQWPQDGKKRRGKTADLDGLNFPHAYGTVIGYGRSDSFIGDGGHGHARHPLGAWLEGGTSQRICCQWCACQDCTCCCMKKNMVNRTAPAAAWKRTTWLTGLCQLRHEKEQETWLTGLHLSAAWNRSRNMVNRTVPAAVWKRTRNMVNSDS